MKPKNKNLPLKIIKTTTKKSSIKIYDGAESLLKVVNRKEKSPSKIMDNIELNTHQKKKSSIEIYNEAELLLNVVNTRKRKSPPNINDNIELHTQKKKSSIKIYDDPDELLINDVNNGKRKSSVKIYCDIENEDNSFAINLSNHREEGTTDETVNSISKSSIEEKRQDATSGICFCKCKFKL